MNNLKQIKQAKFRPGTKVKYKEKEKNLAPTGMEEKTFTIKCNHGDYVYLFPQKNNYPLTNPDHCHKHKTCWIAQKKNLDIIK